ncbi:CASP-like protein 1C2 [Impatiens glandulifera]|uniref:CASP-like protein 1C2 n=1 Tax=Impatiens glandulifera TaxID=253017 RepID=UPI001FB13442|nr:CASP-like protein 1C2 [Impatiens glandulifera]
MGKDSRLYTILPRLLALGATVVAAIVMATSRQKTTFFVISLDPKFSYTLAFRYFVAGNVIGAVYGGLTLLASPKVLLSTAIIVSDVAVTMLLTSCSSAALFIALLGKRGDLRAGWLPICEVVEGYCGRVTAAIIAGFIAVGFHFISLLHTIPNAKALDC